MANEKDETTNLDNETTNPTTPLSKIPTTKVQRATEFMKTGVKVGGNYIKHYAKKVINPNLDRRDLDADNAKDIYDSLSQLKGSALKVAQMMSMDKSVLPKAYADKFSMAQYSAPPLSYPLVVNTFRKHLGKSPEQIFDTFSKEAVNAASIGQVHKATKGNKTYAVKVQYPGVAESISSDLRMVRPFAMQILRLSEKDLDLYMGEVEQMLKSETDYRLELKRSVDISAACDKIPNLFFAKYYPELSCDKILTMDWVEGMHLDKFLATNPSQEIRNKIGQSLWNFYDFQMHELLTIHADPHPGNFLMRENGDLAILDFGCVKVIPQEYYEKHFQIINPGLFEDNKKLAEVFVILKFLYEDDTAQEKQFFFDLFKEMLTITLKPFKSGVFDFGDESYFNHLFTFGEKLATMDEMRKSTKPRGAKDALYINRTYFGLYTILHDLKAVVNTETTWKQKYEASLA
jgi:predicted unusual protein kinase regulating ubiquinone biosynthesis (AarF/ABC1/UbiB family)